MQLCYSCFLELKGESQNWDSYLSDTKVSRKCEKCGLTGIYVRPIPTQKVAQTPSDRRE